jgi:starch synthase
MMVSSEASPWAKTGGLADVLEALPKALAAAGHQVCVVIPRYMHGFEAPSERVVDQMPLAVGGAVYDVAVYRLVTDGVTIFFVDHAGIYGRNGLYGDHFGDFGDNHIRYAVLCKAALEISRTLFPVDIYHCHDWQAGLLPVYLRALDTGDPHFMDKRTVMTIHNLGYQGIFPREKMREVSLPDWLFRPDLIEFWGNISYLKAGLVYGDALTTVSRRYAQEIQTPEHGFGLDGLLRARSNALTGIVNGVDYSRWNPETDEALPSHYSAEELDGKAICKRELLREMGLPDEALNRPLLTIVSRFAYQKGVDLIAGVAHTLFREEDVYLAVLGNGEQKYEDYFRHLRSSFPDRVGLRIGYDDALAHRIEAGGDIFLMPSRYEPCGLNQIYSLRYGTVPLVRATGGLDDTIDAETGFKFSDYNGKDLLETIRLACRAWDDRETWTRMMRRGMAKDFSWATAAAEYSRLYRDLQPFAGQ